MSDAAETIKGVVAGLLGIASAGSSEKDHKPLPTASPLFHDPHLRKRIKDAKESAKKAKRGEHKAKIDHEEHKARLRALYKKMRTHRSDARKDPDSRYGHEMKIKIRERLRTAGQLVKKHGKGVRASLKKGTYDNVDVYRWVKDEKGSHKLHSHKDWRKVNESLIKFRKFIRENTPSDREIGKASLTKIYAAETPGECKRSKKKKK